MMETKPWHRHYDYYAPTSIRYPKISVPTFFSGAAAQFPDRPAMSFLGAEMSFWQTREQMRRLANALGKLGIKKGDRVGLQLPNCPQFVVSYLAVLSLGAIVVNINPLYTKEELKFILNNTKMETLITFDMVLPVVRAIVQETDVKRVIVSKITDFIHGLGISSIGKLDLAERECRLSDLIGNCPTISLPKIPFSSDDPALIQFTGGTTGFPKGAVLTHANLVAATMQSAMWGPPPSAMRQLTVLGVIPYFHVYGNISCMNWAFFAGATQIMMPQFNLEDIFATMAKYDEISYFPAVPTMISAVINSPQVVDLRLDRRIKLLNSGGAPMPAELIDKVKDMGIAFSEGYGLSESAALALSNPLLSHKIGSIGVPMADNDVRLVHIENGVEDVAPGEPGEIILKGPTVMREYWNNPEETRNQLHDGWLYTGDIAQTDEDGYFYIVDRKKDMIIAGGFNIYPREVDEVLYQHPQILEAVTVGVPDDYRGETVKAFIVLRPGKTATEKDIIRFCREKLVAYKVPKLVEFRDSLPKSAVGKVLRKILRDEEISKKKTAQ